VLRKRIVAALRDGTSCGEVLYTQAASCGARACGRAAGTIAVGQRADLVVLPRDDEPDTLLDRYVFATDRAAPRAVYVGGRRRALREHVLR
jgi:formimidoylglutamate deiminase